MKYSIMYLLAFFLVSASNPAFAGDPGNFEYSLYVPFTQEQTIDFEGGAEVRLENDPGIGFSMGYNMSEKLTYRVDASWNTIGYSATRIADDGADTVERYSGDLSSFAMSVGADYYLTNGPISPFINGNLGWSYADSNVADSNFSTACWYDPWWGYTCVNNGSSYDSSKFYYGVGAGVRFEISRNNFVRLGYFESFRDFNRASGTPSIGTFRLEFGASY